jgi:hypothetical protein
MSEYAPPAAHAADPQAEADTRGIALHHLGHQLQATMILNDPALSSLLKKA